MRFVSNITPSDLLTKYPDLQKEYEDLDVDLNDNYTLVFAKSLRINNNDYFGKWLDPDGNPDRARKHLHLYILQNTVLDRSQAYL